MSKYCECCEYKTNLTANFKKHLLSKKHILVNKKSTICHPIDNPLTTLPSYVCKYCEQSFKFRQSMYRHIKYSCTKNKDEDLKELVRLLNLQLQENRNEIQKQKNELTEHRNRLTEHKNEIKEQQNKIQVQDKKIEKLKGKLEIHGSFNTTNIQNNFTLLGYRETDVSHLTDDDYRFCIKKVNHCVKSLIDKVHFNPMKPENRNIYISNMKDKYLMVYDGSNWNLANKKEELERLFEEKEMMLEEWLESNPDPILKDKFLKYLNNKEDDVCLNQIKEEIKLMLYNKGELISLE